MEARRHGSLYLSRLSLSADLKIEDAACPQILRCGLLFSGCVRVPTHVRNVCKCICKIQDTKRDAVAAAAAACLTSASSDPP